MDTQIEITLNGESHTLGSGMSLKALIEQLGLGQQKVAIEVNQEIVPRSEHAAFLLSAGDRVEIVQAIGGG